MYFTIIFGNHTSFLKLVCNISDKNVSPIGCVMSYLNLSNQFHFHRASDKVSNETVLGVGNSADPATSVDVIGHVNGEVVVDHMFSL